MPISLSTLISNKTSAAIADSTINTDKLSNSAITAEKIAANSVIATKIAENAVTAEKIAANSVTATKIADGSITPNKLDESTQANIAGAIPKITNITYNTPDLSLSPEGGEQVIITGSGFQSGATVYIQSTIAPSVTYTNSTSISFITPSLSPGDYIVYVYNPDGTIGVGIPGISFSGSPSWVTASGSLTNATENPYTTTVNATSDSNITYSVYSGALPEGLSLNANTGTISGTLASNIANLSSNTSYNFTISATDQELQNTERSFSILYVPTFPTWYSPSAGALPNANVGSSYTVTLNALSNSNVTYTIPSGNLVGGLSLSGNTISGAPSEAGTFNFTVRASDEEAHYTDRAFSITSVAVLATSYQSILNPSGETVRSDPFSPYLALAMPVNLTYGYSDISATVKGTGSNKTVTVSDSTLSTTAKYYTRAGLGGFRASMAMDQYADLTFEDQFCVELWFRQEAVGRYGFFFGKASTDNGKGKGWKIFTNIGEYGVGNPGKFGFSNNDSDFTTLVVPASSDTTNFAENYALNTWHHLAITRDANNLCRIYFNGTVVKTATYVGTIPASNGFQFATAAYAYTGQWQDFRVYKGTSKYSTSGFTV